MEEERITYEVQYKNGYDSLWIDLLEFCEEKCIDTENINEYEYRQITANIGGGIWKLLRQK